MKIPILNIYYLLCYAWNRLDEGEIISVSQRDMSDVSQLFAKVLIEGTTHLFKKGLDRGYIEYSDEIQKIRGKIDFTLNIKRNYFRQPRLYCDFDEFDNNILHNQILKATIRNMINCDGLTAEMNSQLKNLFLRLHKIDDISLAKKNFHQVRLHRNNIFYDFLMKVCGLIFDNLLISKENGKGKFRDFIQDDEIMRRIFEEFIRNFYKREQHIFKVRRENIDWDAEPLDDVSKSVLPNMQTDISLVSENRKIVIDTKYTKNTFQEYFTKKSIRSENLYQLFSYLINLEAKENQNLKCEGILLYPMIDVEHEYRYIMRGHKIKIKTINLNQEWQNIHNDLLNVIN